MNESRMNGTWASFSRRRKDLPANSSHLINRSPSPHHIHPTPSLSLHLPTPPSKWSHLFNVQTKYHISGDIFLTRCDDAATKRKQTSATEAKNVMKRTKKRVGVRMCKWWWKNRWEDDDCRIKERNYMSVTHTFLHKFHWLPLFFWITHIFPNIYFLYFHPPLFNLVQQKSSISKS